MPPTPSPTSPKFDPRRLRPVVLHTSVAVGIQGKKKFAVKDHADSASQVCEEIVWHPLGVAVKFGGKWFVVANFDNIRCEEDPAT